MSSHTTRNSINRLEKEISALDKKSSDEAKKEVDKVKRINQIEKSITSSTSAGSIRSKQSQIIRLQSDTVQIRKRQVDISKKKSYKNQQIGRLKQQLQREEAAENTRARAEMKELYNEQLAMQKQITGELEKQKELKKELEDKGVSLFNGEKEYDFFISHASEDKKDFVGPLAKKLIDKGMKVWYDEFELMPGDSLRRSIDNGLKKSKFGIVVLSHSFFAKEWPQYELDGMVAREVQKVKVIVPIWHNVSKDEVLSYSPTLADRVALNSAIYTLDDIVDKLIPLIQA